MQDSYSVHNFGRYRHNKDANILASGRLAILLK
jgi:hypothetical protein